ncbi:MAG: hypothetical protein EXX96DRAFT_613057 [Benjaminiella poitrasii]|nr:MAG: hypothetical protein EXX96DRAFT_613057 [Benjaminiella poitrasii]
MYHNENGGKLNGFSKTLDPFLIIFDQVQKHVCFSKWVTESSVNCMKNLKRFLIADNCQEETKSIGLFSSRIAVTHSIYFLTGVSIFWPIMTNQFYFEIPNQSLIRAI